LYKKTYLPKLALYGLMLSAIIIVTINSCKKDLHTTSGNLKPLTADTSLTAQAKAWYQSVYPDVKTSTAQVQDAGAAKQDWSKTFSPYWAKAQTFVQDSLTIIELPALKKGNMAMTLQKPNPQNFDFSKSPSITSIIIVIYKGYINAYAMTIIGDSTYIGGNYAKLKNNTYRKKDKDFSGMVFYNAMDGTFINGWRYVNGTVTNPIIQTINGSSTPVIQSLTNKRQINLEEPCVITVDAVWEDCSYYTSDVDDQDPFDCYEYTVSTDYDATCVIAAGGGGGGITPPAPTKCTPPTVSDEGFNGHLVIHLAAPPTTPQPPTEPCPPTKTVITPVSSAVNTITDSVTNPCLKAIIDNLTNNNTIQTDVTSILRNTFGVNDQVNLTFDQATLPGTEDASTGGGQKDQFEITFNTSQITNASKEFLLETTMHEIFHAYLDENPTVNAGFSQHAYMITNYVNTEVQTLQTVFPNLSTHDAECLVLGGFGVLQQNNPTVFNAALAQYNLSASDVQSTNNSYQSGSSGTHC
jgi:hypothetical protein